MSKQRMVNTKFWDDTYVRQLEADEKLLFLYFLTNQLTNICGIYEISQERIIFDTKIKEKRLNDILIKFEQNKKVIYRNGWIWINNFIKNQNTNESVILGIKRSLNEIPEQVHTTLGTGWGGGGYTLGELNLTKLNLTNKVISKKLTYDGMPVRNYFGTLQAFNKGEWKNLDPKYAKNIKEE